MAQFSLELIESIRGRQAFYKLKLDNGYCPLDEFCEKIENTSYASELRTIFTYMDLIANNNTLPHTKFKDLTSKKDKYKEYEFKSKHLRVYVFHDAKSGKVVVCGGMKTEQKSDIKYFRNLKKQYFTNH
jgi:putative component of toxin-antitoxin plasmid stabilization module